MPRKKVKRLQKHNRHKVATVIVFSFLIEKIRQHPCFDESKVLWEQVTLVQQQPVPSLSFVLSHLLLVLCHRRLSSMVIIALCCSTGLWNVLSCPPDSFISEGFFCESAKTNNVTREGLMYTHKVKYLRTRPSILCVTQ